MRLMALVVLVSKLSVPQRYDQDCLLTFIGQWSNFVANALVILGPALFVRNGYAVIPDEAERNSNPQNIPESYNHYCHRGDGNSIYSGISRVSSASGSRSPSPGRLYRSSTTPVDGAEPSSLELRRFTTSQTPGRARTGRRRQNPLRLWLQGICSTPPSGYERIFYYCVSSPITSRTHV